VQPERCHGVFQGVLSMGVPRRLVIVLAIGGAAFAGAAVPQAASDVILRASSAMIVRGTWQSIPDPSALDGTSLTKPDRVHSKGPALASPADYFEHLYDADAATP
jgi:hypothetical protein